MKFAKELEDNLVPEWKEKYLDYKQGKKKLKAVARAIRNADKSPFATRQQKNTPVQTSLRDAPVYSYLNRGRPDEPYGHHGNGATLAPTRSRSEVGGDGDGDRTPRPSAQPMPINERSPLFPKPPTEQAEGRGMTRYGSIIGSPPNDDESPAMSELQKQASLLELPDPALDPQRSKDGQARETETPQRASASAHSGSLQATRGPPPPRTQTHELLSTNTMHRPATSTPSNLQAPRYQSLFKPKRVNSMPGDARPFVRRMFSITGAPSPRAQRHANTNAEVELEAYRELDFRQAEFFMYLDRQLEKIEDFYKQKEAESTERLKVLREQLHVMRNRRLEEVMQAEHHKLKNFSQNNEHHSNGGLVNKLKSEIPGLNSASYPSGRRSTIAPYVDNAVNHIDAALGKVKNGHVGKTSKAMSQLGTPHFPPERGASQGALPASSANCWDPDHRENRNADQRDYTRRPTSREVPYRVAKRKLKLALAEYYRGLELLKSYALMNRTAFRKITKKYDKTVTARPSGRYMTEKVNKAHFVNSEIVDGHLTAVEDLYARYFERGSHKVAVGKLRAKMARAGDYTGSVWRQGVLATAGLVFGFEGLVYGVQQLMQEDDLTMSSHASYLLQIYAGYFLMLSLAGMFVLDARAFSRAKVNYGFIFELDTRHMLDWRQLSEIPALFLFILGFTMWCNFQQFGGMPMYTYWPIFLIVLSAATLFLPAPFFYHRTRKWFLYSNWRLLLAGIYPVEFRDFFLGDMFCSQTYALGNIELFFCLYARDWNQPAMCNSSNSRLLGFFSCLPGIWRALQCLRRYYDTRNVFPHLVNGGKYSFTILQYMSLSLFRVHKTHSLLAFFIFSATINSIYCSVWDIVMDWSLGVPGAKHRFLRHTLAYKNIWWYYFAMVIDPILRFNWIFYAIYAYEIQHSSLVSFLVAFSEVIRRGIWVLFRVENEHCTNVGRFRASRDVPLPYEIEHESRQSLLHERDEDPTAERPSTHDGAMSPQAAAQPPPSGRTQTSDFAARPARSATTATDLEHGPTTPSLRQRRRQSFAADSPITRALRSVGSTMLSAHAQDYERRRKPELGKADGADDSDEDDEESSEEDNAAPAGGSGGGGRPSSGRVEQDDDDNRRDIGEAEDAVAMARGEQR